MIDAHRVICPLSTAPRASVQKWTAVIPIARIVRWMVTAIHLALLTKSASRDFLLNG